MARSLKLFQQNHTSFSEQKDVVHLKESELFKLRKKDPDEELAERVAAWLREHPKARR